MAEITQQELQQQIKDKKFSSLYFIYGEDVYLRQKYVQELGKSIVTDLPEMNMLKIDGKNITSQRISEEIYQMPILSDRRCVIIEDFDVATLDKDSISELKSLFADIPETAVLIMVFKTVEIDTKNSNWNGVINSASKNGCVINCKYKTNAELVKFITAFAKRKGVVIDYSIARYLIEKSGKDLKMLEAEVEKLCSYKKDYISKQDIDRLSSKTPEATQYMLPKSILSKNISGSINILSDLLDMRFNPNAIIYAIADSFIDIYRVKTALDCGKQPLDIASDFGYKKSRFFVLENAAAEAKKYSFTTLTKCFEILDEADEKLKSGEKNERLLLEKTIILLIETIRGYNTRSK